MVVILYATLGCCYGCEGVPICLLSISVSRLFFFQAEDGIRDLVRSRGLGDVYKRQVVAVAATEQAPTPSSVRPAGALRALTAAALALPLSLIHI